MIHTFSFSTKLSNSKFFELYDQIIMKNYRQKVRKKVGFDRKSCQMFESFNPNENFLILLLTVQPGVFIIVYILDICVQFYQLNDTSWSQPY